MFIVTVDKAEKIGYTYRQDKMWFYHRIKNYGNDSKGAMLEEAMYLCFFYYLKYLLVGGANGYT